LDEASILGDINADVVMMSRLDGVLRSKSDGMLYVFELKTAKTLDTRTLRQLQYDDQGLAQSLRLRINTTSQLRGNSGCIC
jgi:hypothetical protein